MFRWSGRVEGKSLIGGGGREHDELGGKGLAAGGGRIDCVQPLVCYVLEWVTS